MNYCGKCGTKLNAEGICENCQVVKRNFCEKCGRRVIENKCICEKDEEKNVKTSEENLNIYEKDEEKRTEKIEKQNILKEENQKNNKNDEVREDIAREPMVDLDDTVEINDILEDIILEENNNIEDNNIEDSNIGKEEYKKNDNEDLKVLEEEHKNEKVERVSKKEPIELSFKNEKKNTKNEKVRLPKKNKKVLIGSSIAGVAIVGVAIGGMVYYNSPSRVISSFEEALAKGDKKALANMVMSDNDSFLINEDNIGAFTEYYKDKEDERKALSEELKSDIKKIKDEGEIDALAEEHSAFLMVDGKKFIFNNYKVAINTKSIFIKPNVNNVQIFIDGEEIAKDISGTVEIGPLVPGKHEIIVKCDGVEEKQEVDLLDNTLGGRTLEFFKEAFYIEVKSNKEKYDLYIDEKKVKTVEGKEERLGPFTSEVSIYGVLKVNDKEIKTEVIRANSESKNIELKFMDEEEKKKDFENSLNKFMEEYLKALTEAINSNDISKVKNYLEIDSESYKNVETLIKGQNEAKNKRKFESFSVISYKMDKEGKGLDAIINEKFEIINEEEKSEMKEEKETYKINYNKEKNEFKIVQILKEKE